MKTVTILLLIAWAALTTFAVMRDDVGIKNLYLVLLFSVYAAYAIALISQKGSD
jgi:Fe2+ transport system protein B